VVADHGMTGKLGGMALEHPWSEPPAPAATIDVAPGIRWLRMPLPFQLDHINLWLLADGDGWTAVDTGLALPPTRERWEQLGVRRWGVWVDGTVQFSTGRASRKAKNLERDPRCVVMTEDAREAVVVEGTAARVAMSDAFVDARSVPAACAGCDHVANCGGGCAGRRRLMGALDRAELAVLTRLLRGGKRAPAEEAGSIH